MTELLWILLGLVIGTPIGLITAAMFAAHSVAVANRHADLMDRIHWDCEQLSGLKH